MKLIKKYWWIAVLVLVLPVVINFTLQIPAFTPIVGDSEVWLSFWGDYLGSIISASVAFIILAIQYKQNEKENQSNRQLQINVIKHQQAQAQLHDIINVSEKLISDTDITNITKICCYIGEPNYNVIEMLEDLSRNIDTHQKILELYINAYSDSSEERTIPDIEYLVASVNVALNDITNIIHVFNVNNGNMSISTLKDRLVNIVSDDMKTILSEYGEPTNHKLNYKHCLHIISLRISPMIKLQIKIYSNIRKYIYKEKIRIDKILTDNFN